MPSYIRFVRPGGTFFLTFVTFERRPILTTSSALASLASAYHKTRSRRRFLVEAFCVLPDHIHTMVRLPRGDSDFSTKMRAFKTFFTRGYLASGGEETEGGRPRSWKGERAIWQPRFWEHTIRDVTDFERHVHYIHYNPVKHSLVSDPQEWPWSSFHRFRRKEWYPEGWGRIAPEIIEGMEDTGE